MKHIEISKGYKVQVDDEDFEYFSKWQWMASVVKGKVYAQRPVSDRGKLRSLKLHRAIAERMGIDGSNQIDHRNGDTLDNQRDNLRAATNTQNSQNRAKINNKAGFKGVFQRKDTGKWRARITVNGKPITLGQRFASAKEAAIAYNNAAVQYFGEYASLNYIDS